LTTREPYETDSESVTIDAVQEGGPVDPPARPATFADIVARTEPLGPVIPAVLRSKDQRRELYAWAGRTSRYLTVKHTVRSPLYGWRIAKWAPRGAGMLLRDAWRWAYDLEQWGQRQAAATAGDVDGYMRLMSKADRHRRGRVPMFFTCLILLGVAGLLVWLLAPWWVQGMLLVAALVTFAAVGKPDGKQIVERTTVGPQFTRLTAEQVRAALCSMGVSGLKDPATLSFPPPGVHRNGPGWLARVNLPMGVVAEKVVEERGKLSSGLRLPVDQVWPSQGPDHAGQLDLWVGYFPASKMGRARWPLATPAARTSVFDPIPFGVDPQQRPVSTTLFQRNYLVGGQPGSGKTFAGRALVLGGLLDPTVEVWLGAFKPSEDFHDVAEFCTRYVCGVDPVTMLEAERMVADGLAEVRRRQTLLGRLKRDGKIAEGRTDPELAAKGIGLHPLLIVFDEVHELFLESPKAAEDMIRLVKQGRSAGVIAVLITQVADKDSVPPNLTRCVSSRWCLSVSDQVANDQIMGTGAYKRGQSGTAYRPRVDAGWGATSGMADEYDGPVRAYYPDAKELTTVLDRIRTLRRGGMFSTDPGHAAARDVLADVLKVFAYAGRPGLHWQTLAALLSEQAPEAYAGITAEAVSARVRGEGVPSEDIKVDGTVLKGCKRREVEATIQRRAIGGSGSGPTSPQNGRSRSDGVVR
jgi:S-DNA-T family DNA segregation ATPase FtsK/SpoIIIE